MNNKKIRAAIIGCGNIARVHAGCLEKNGCVQLAAVCDVAGDRAKSLAGDHGANWYTSYEEMLDQEAIDVVHICTPHYLHVPMTIDCLKRGKNVFLEKPPVISQSQLDELELAPHIERAGICFQNRYNPGLIRVKAMLQSGETGKILGARGIVTWFRDEEYYAQSGWRGRLETEGGGVLINQSIHTLDLLVYLLGRPDAVCAGMANHHLKEIIEVEDTMEAYIEFENGKAVFYVTTAYCENLPPLIEVSCENMVIRLEEPQITVFHRDGRTERITASADEALGKKYWGSGHEACIRDYYSAVAEGRKLPITLAEVKDSVRLMTAMYEAAGTGRRIELNSQS